MSDAVENLLTILDLERLEDNLFRGVSMPEERPRVFGGQVVAQALVAASRTVAGRAPHSLHAYFLLGGNPAVPIVYEVDRIRDGNSFTTRRVVAIQAGKAIFSMSVSFHIDEPGLSHQIEMPPNPDADSLPDGDEFAAGLPAGLLPSIRAYFERDWPIDIRPVDMARYLRKTPSSPHHAVWIRAASALPDDPAIHRAVLVYASDMTLLDTALVAHGKSIFSPDIMAASLDHSLWLHRPFRADEWMLYVQDSPSSGGARGFARGEIFSQNGVLIASVAQEGLIRHRRNQPRPLF